MLIADRTGWPPSEIDALTPDELDDWWDDLSALDEARRKFARERR